MILNIINEPDDAKLYEFIVVRPLGDDEYLYVGKYTNEETAKRIAQERQDGIIIHNTSIKGKRKKRFVLALDVECDDIEADSIEEAKEKFLAEINDNLFINYVECYEDEDD